MKKAHAEELKESQKASPSKKETSLERSKTVDGDGHSKVSCV